MRNCPHCSNEIQDQAIYCRHCHEEVEPPLWLSSMVRCPYCAEWIESDSEDCPYCRKNLEGMAAEPATAPFIDSSVDELIQDFRAAGEEQEAGTQEQAPAELPAPDTSPLEQPPPKTDLSTFRSQMLERKPLWEKLPGLSRSPDDEDRPRIDVERAASSPVFRIAVGIIGFGIVAVAAIGIVRSLDLGGSAAAPAPTRTRAPATTSTPVRLPTQTVQELAPADTEAAPTEQAAELDCVQWDEVSLEDAGQEMCVFGIVKRWFAVDEIPFVAIFSEEAGTFAFVDRTTAHQQASPGTCIMGTGVVEVMSATRPNIDLQGELELCPES